VARSCWQDPPSRTYRTWDDAVAYCAGLDSGGHADWRLPTISELRSLIRGCPATMASGDCGVIDSCLAGVCRTAECEGCYDLGGPGGSGCYWDPTLSGKCILYWSSSSYASDPFYAWNVTFYFGDVYYYEKTSGYSARCVRLGP